MYTSTAVSSTQMHCVFALGGDEKPAAAIYCCILHTILYASKQTKKNPVRVPGPIVWLHPDQLYFTVRVGSRSKRSPTSSGAAGWPCIIMYIRTESRVYQPPKNDNNNNNNNNNIAEWVEFLWMKFVLYIHMLEVNFGPKKKNKKKKTESLWHQVGHINNLGEKTFIHAQMLLPFICFSYLTLSKLPWGRGASGGGIGLGTVYWDCSLVANPDPTGTGLFYDH